MISSTVTKLDAMRSEINAIQEGTILVYGPGATSLIRNLTC